MCKWPRRFRCLDAHTRSAPTQPLPARHRAPRAGRARLGALLPLSTQLPCSTPPAGLQASKRRKPKEPKARPQVISAARDQVYGGGPLTGEQILENRVVQSLALLFVLILGEGLFLGASVSRLAGAAWLGSPLVCH